MKINSVEDLKSGTPSTGNVGLDNLLDLIAARVVARLLAAQPSQRLIDVKMSAEYIGRTPAALRHMISKV
jgi:hypothetical protein